MQSIGLSGTGLAALITPAVTVSPASSKITTSEALSVTVALSGGNGNPTPTGSVVAERRRLHLVRQNAERRLGEYQHTSWDN